MRKSRQVSVWEEIQKIFHGSQLETAQGSIRSALLLVDRQPGIVGPIALQCRLVTTGTEELFSQ